MSETLMPITVASASSRRFKAQEDGPTVSSHTVKAKNSMMNLKLRKSAKKIEADDAAQTSQGWSMVALVFFTNFLVLGFFKSLGILTKILSKEFSATMNVYVLMCIAYSLNCVAGPLACYLTRVYSAKSIAIIGTSLVSFGLLTSWFGNSLAFLYLSIGTFVGIGSGLTYPTGVILVGNYFIGTKNAAFANAFVVSGSPIGGMIMPLVVSWLAELYTSRGAFLVVGICMLGSIICARFFKSPDEGRAGNTLEVQENSGDSQRDIENAKEPEVKSVTNVEKLLNNNAINRVIDPNENVVEGKEKLSIANFESRTGVYKLFERDDDAELVRKMTGETSLESFCEQSHHHYHPDQPLPFVIGSKMGSGTKSVFLSGTGQTVHDRKAGDAEANIYLRPFGKKSDSNFKGKQRMVVGSFPGLESLQKSPEINNSLGVGVFSDNEMVCHCLNEDNDIIVNRAEVNVNYTLHSRKSNNFGTSTPIQTSSHPYVLALDHSCLILCSKTDVKRQVMGTPTFLQRHDRLSASHLHNSGSGEEGDDEEPGVKIENRSCWQMTKDWVVASPLQNSTYLFLLLSNMSTAISTTNIHLMVAQLVEDSGTGDYTKSSMIYLLMAFADLTGRLLGAFITDKKFISASVVYGVGLLCAGISSSLFATYSSFNFLCVGALVFGLSSGFHVGIYGLLLTNTVGLEKIHLGYGISMCINGSLQCIAILLSGKTISKYRNGFVWLSPLLGGILVIGGVIWCLAIIFFRAGLETNVTRSEDESDSTE